MHTTRLPRLLTAAAALALSASAANAQNTAPTLAPARQERQLSEINIDGKIYVPKTQVSVAKPYIVSLDGTRYSVPRKAAQPAGSDSSIAVDGTEYVLKQTVSTEAYTAVIFDGLEYRPKTAADGDVRSRAPASAILIEGAPYVLKLTDSEKNAHIISINGAAYELPRKPIKSTATPVNINGREYVPFDAVMSALFIDGKEYVSVPEAEKVFAIPEAAKQPLPPPPSRNATQDRQNGNAGRYSNEAVNPVPRRKENYDAHFYIEPAMILLPKDYPVRRSYGAMLGGGFKVANTGSVGHINCDFDVSVCVGDEEVYFSGSTYFNNSYHNYYGTFLYEQTLVPVMMTWSWETSSLANDHLRLRAGVTCGATTAIVETEARAYYSYASVRDSEVALSYGFTLGISWNPVKWFYTDLNWRLVRSHFSEDFGGKVTAHQINLGIGFRW
jgi:hypothetical protein